MKVMFQKFCLLMLTMMFTVSISLPVLADANSESFSLPPVAHSTSVSDSEMSSAVGEKEWMNNNDNPKTKNLLIAFTRIQHIFAGGEIFDCAWIVIGLVSFDLGTAFRIRCDLSDLGLPFYRHGLLRGNYSYSRFGESFEKLSSDDLDIDVDADALGEVYQHLMYMYSEATRRLLSGQGDYTSDLSMLTGRQELHNLQYRIEYLAGSALVEEITVTSFEVLGYKMLGRDVVVAKVKVKGHDHLVNVDSEFKETALNQEWIDYVVFGCDFSNWKIYNWVTGKHQYLDSDSEDFSTDDVKEAASYIQYYQGHIAFPRETRSFAYMIGFWLVFIGIWPIFAIIGVIGFVNFVNVVLGCGTAVIAVILLSIVLTYVY